MRIDAEVTSPSWIPQDAMSGLMKMPIDLGISHYDRPPPEHIDDIGARRERASLEGGFRTATLRAVSPVRVTNIRPEQIDQSALAEIAKVHGGEGST